MNPELQPVIIVANTTTSVRAVPVRYAVFAELILSLGGEPLFSLWNPPSSGVLARIRKYAYTFDDAQDILNFCLAPQDVVLPPGPGKRGQRMFTSRVPVTPLSEKQNASFVSLATAEGASLGIGRFDEIMLPSAFPPGPLAKGRLERDFDIVLGPGASFSTFEHNVPLGARREAYYEWEEEPLT
jgi:hypothetical protein